MSARTLRLALVTLVAVATLALAGLTSAVQARPSTHHDTKTKQDAGAFHDDMRKLWEDHVTWTRMFIVDFVADSPATQTSAERLLANQDDIGEAVAPFYGEQAGSRLTALLKDHIIIAGELLTAAKAGDQNAVEDASGRWYANADDIAAFLASANPEQWDGAEMRAMMREHLDITLEEAVARLQGDWAADVAAYDEVHVQILHMADMLSDGIVKQFPKSFN